MEVEDVFLDDDNFPIISGLMGNINRLKHELQFDENYS